MTVELNGFKQTIFLDHIIRLTLCRAHANSQAKRFITADKLLGLAEKMILMVKQGDPFAKLIGEDKNNILEIKLRQEAPLIPIEIL